MLKSSLGNLTKSFLSWGMVVGLFLFLFLVGVPNALAANVAPTGLYVDATSTEAMTLHWVAGGGVEATYSVWASLDGIDYNLETTAATTSPDFLSYIVTDLATNTEYFLVVTAEGGGGDPATSSYTLATTPVAPTVDNPAITTLDVTVNADTNPTDTNFAVYETGSDLYLNLDGSLGAVEWATSTHTQYSFVVVAKNTSDVLTASSSAATLYTLATTPGIPTIGTPTTSTMPITIDVGTNPVGTEYAIYNSTSGYFLSALGASNAGTPIWQSTTTWGANFPAINLATNTLYQFVVLAQNGDDISTATSTASSATAGTIAIAPTTVSATTLGKTSIQVAWATNGNSANTTYKVAYSNGTLIGTTTDLSYDVTALSPGTSYTFKVAALYKNDGVTYSPYSSTATALTNSSPNGGGSSDTTPPTNISIKINENAVTAQSNQVTLTLLASGASQMILSNTSDFTGATWEAYNSSKIWLLTTGAGTKTVYVKFRDSSFNVSSVVSDSIDYLSATVVETPVVVTTTPPVVVVTPPTTCALTTKSAYKLATSPAVYYITPECTKRAFNKSNVFFTYFTSWNDVKTTTKTILDTIPNDTLGFMPWGPKYDPKYGALVKIVTDPKVYLLLGTEKYWITSEAVFNTLKYSWNWIEDIDSDLLNKYTTGSEITNTTVHPNYTLIKYANNSKVYRLEPNPTDATKQVKRWIPNETVFNSLNFRLDRIVTVLESEGYTDGAELN
ncbi:MAG: hypothetical protein US42_C0007G0014 [Candidatus Magasanikbacteria bacterium GW2011_GWC2_37_14]|uniref:Fibronectin type-III domain-containing protein n=1 Tax=Candidatus Magasanikbacteria bacterium GW2011_GWC2_37_14 TaxID=1619046 RepID=A0A0G0G966_9BACT|nr:MAG: hypothetical protein US42_C0007G0014 [Candidatus Magasanikbacteria bacterium GW2011_GWC2_37_14]